MSWATPVARTIERGVKLGLVTVFGVGVRRRNPGAVVNSVVALGVTYLPSAVESRYGVEFRPWQRVYAGGSMLAHAVGMLGLYEETWWWDHLTHFLSATLLGGVVHAAARRLGQDPRPRVLAAVAGGGVLWELLEYSIHGVSRRLGVEPILIPYSARDTVLDLVFNTIGALLVLAFGDRLLGNFVDHSE